MLQTALFTLMMLAGTFVVDVLVLMVLAFTAGPSVKDGELAVFYAVIAYGLIAVAGIALHWSFNGIQSGAHRLIATGLFGVFELLVIAVMIAITLIALNR